MEISDIEASIPVSTVRSIVVILNGVTVTAVVGTDDGDSGGIVIVSQLVNKVV